MTLTYVYKITGASEMQNSKLNFLCTFLPDQILALYDYLIHTHEQTAFRDFVCSNSGVSWMLFKREL